MRRIIHAGLMIGIAWWHAYAQATAPLFLRPTQNSVVEAGPLSIVARASAGASVLLDGKPVNTTTPGPGAFTAIITAAPGKHELTVRDSTGSSSVVFFVGAANAPAEAKSFRVHPPPALKAECATCHAVKDARWTFAGASLAANCHNCHQRESFSKTHTHEPVVLRDCQMCHSTHGSTEAKHLKMPAKTACELCHPL
jgi:predicted CXXCH cytochrome family protein